MRVLVYDRTCLVRRGWLTTPWAAGSVLYRAMRRTDASHAATSWDTALAWLAALPEPITELQYWGHGKWGRAFVGEDVLDASTIASGRLEPLRAALARDALVWFRTCETVGAKAGIDFAERLADYTGARVAGHTFVIGFHQSGLHGVAPGMRADWSPSEGLEKGTPDEPVSAAWSHRKAPNTITCLRGAVPDAWFAGAGLKMQTET